MISDINLNLYRVFYTCARSKTFCEASQKLCISQPAVSKEIKELEKILNVKLFHRDSKGLKLTKEGTKLLEYVDKSYNYLIAGQRIITENKDIDNGIIKIGSPSHIASFYLVKFVEKYRKSHPNVYFQIVSASTSELLKKLSEHELDLVIDSSPVDIMPNMKIIELTSYDTCFVTTTDNLESNFQNHNFVMPLEKSSMRKNLKYVLDKKNIQLSIVLEVETTDLIISSVKSKIGTGYVIKNVVENEFKNNELKELHVDFELPKIQLNLIYIDDYLTKLPRYFIKNYILK